METPSGKISVIAGLGNPGKQYELTRHNLGFLVVEEFAAQNGWSFKEITEFNVKVAKGMILNRKIHLLLPTTYMNESGRAIKPYMNYYGYYPSQLLVVSDDIAIPFGEIRLRKAGSSGGHNGLKSVEAHLNTREYARLRMGVGSNLKDTLSNYVLDVFNPEELKQLPDFIKKAANLLEQLVKGLNILENKTV